LHSKTQNFTGIWKYDIKGKYYFYFLAHTWDLINVTTSESKEIPSRRGHASIISQDHRIFIFGGIIGFNKYVNDTLVFDLEVRLSFLSYNKEYKSIQNLVAGDVPSNRAFHSCTLLNQNKVIIYGGLSEQNIISNELFIFNIESFEYNMINKNNSLDCKIYFINK
jgi:hypothetical protein